MSKKPEFENFDQWFCLFEKDETMKVYCETYRCKVTQKTIRTEVRYWDKLYTATVPKTQLAELVKIHEGYCLICETGQVTKEKFMIKVNNALLDELQKVREAHEDTCKKLHERLAQTWAELG